MIDHIARNTSSHIVTLEDPIEYSFKDRKSIITQREIGIDSRSFSLALKYALRQDPDVILVGEMRDEETIRMALSAAETGHLVLSTLHTHDTMETVNRVLGSISSSYQEQVRIQLASVLLGVISQRLVLKADGSGRIPAIEVLIINQRVKEMILDPKRTADLPKAIRESSHLGMQTFDHHLMQLCKVGVITKEEALKTCTNIQDFQLKFKGVEAGITVDDEGKELLSQKERIKAALESEKSPPPIIELDTHTHKKK
jgi:twitching motility protein PilT